MRRTMWVALVSVLALFVVAGGGASSGFAAGHSAKKASSANPMKGLSGGVLHTFYMDLTAVTKVTGGTMSAEGQWWNSTSQSEASLVSQTMAVNSVMVAPDARVVLGDIGQVPKSARKRLAPLRKAMLDLLAASKAFAIDTTTPWAGPGASPGVTKAVVAARIQKDIKRFLTDNETAVKYELWSEAAYSLWLNSK